MHENKDILDSINQNYKPKVIDGVEYIILKKYKSISHAEEIKELLKNRGIEADIDNNVPTVDVTFVSNTHNDQYEISVKQIDFKKAQAVIELENKKLLNEIGKEHYLYQFSDKELYDILLRPDEWGDLDSDLALKLLTERGKPVDVDLLESLKTLRVDHLAKPEEGQTPWVLLGYISALFGGVLGVIIGYSLWRSKKSLPDGSKVNSYSERNQNQGKNIFVMGIVMAIVFLLLRLFLWSN